MYDTYDDVAHMLHQRNWENISSMHQQAHSIAEDVMSQWPPQRLAKSALLQQPGDIRVLLTEEHTYNTMSMDVQRQVQKIIDEILGIHWYCCILGKGIYACLCSPK